MNVYQQKILQAVRILIEPEDDYFKIKKYLDQMHQVYFELTGIKAFTQDNNGDTYLDYGKAVSPVVAANCMMDLMRTKRFLQAVYKAILDVKQQFAGEKLRILYAGSGPYGLLITPLCFLFEETDFSCTILDIHKESTDAVTKVIEALGIGNYFTKIETCDAFTYKAPENERPHIIISEVLQMGLQNEPQVALTHHLAPQLMEGGVFIPKKITLDLYHTKKIPDSVQPTVSDDGITRLPEREEEFLGTVYTLSIQTVSEQLKKNSYPNLKFEPLQVAIPQERDPNDTLEIQTELEVYNDIFLTKRQCSLTIPLTQTSLRGYENDTVFEFEYQVSEKPKTDVRVLHTLKKLQNNL